MGGSLEPPACQPSDCRYPKCGWGSRNEWLGLAPTNGGRGKCEYSRSEKSEARYRGARVAFQVALLFSDFTVPSMVSPFTRPEYSAPATVKLI